MKYLGLRITALVIIVGALVQLILANSYAASGSQVSKLERQRASLLSDIRNLDNQISQKSSLGAIGQKASRLGLVVEKGSFDFVSASTVALLPNATP